MGLIKDVDNIKELLESSIKKKHKKGKFKLPFGIRSGLKMKLKKNYVLTLFLRTNNTATLRWLPIQHDMVYIPETGTYHAAYANYIMNYEGKPFMILPEWSLIPFYPAEEFKKAAEKGELALPQKVIIDAAKMARLGSPKKMLQGKMMIGIFVAIVVVIGLVFQAFSG